MSRSPAGISGCVIARDESANIEACLASLAFCDECVVIDSGSTDDTMERAAAGGARVLARDWPGYAAQKQRAIEAATHNWVVCIDADERVPPSLADEIRALQRSGFPEHAAWSMPRCTRYLGAWIRHGTWYPDRCIRLFDRRRARWVPHPDHAVHERVEVNGTVGSLQADLEHQPYRTLDEHLATIDAYTSLIAEGLHTRGRRPRLGETWGHPIWEWIRFYFLKRGFLDGWRGFLLAGLHAHYVRSKYVKLRRLGQVRRV